MLAAACTYWHQLWFPDATEFWAVLFARIKTVNSPESPPLTKLFSHIYYAHLNLKTHFICRSIMTHMIAVHALVTPRRILLINTDSQAHPHARSAC